MNSEIGPDMLEHERKLWIAGIGPIAGIDEAGRGPLAGPVVAAAVIADPGFFIAGVTDSKKLTAAQRDEFYERIMIGAAAVGVGVVDHATIDRINILEATFEAMHEAVRNLRIAPAHLLIDGNRFRPNGIAHTTIVGGDGLSFLIASASIVAKVTRDRIMRAYAKEYPGYGFEKHKGYGTAEHLRAMISRLSQFTKAPEP